MTKNMELLQSELSAQKTSVMALEESLAQRLPAEESTCAGFSKESLLGEASLSSEPESGGVLLASQRESAGRQQPEIQAQVSTARNGHPPKEVGIAIASSPHTSTTPEPTSPTLEDRSCELPQADSQGSPPSVSSTSSAFVDDLYKMALPLLQLGASPKQKDRARSYVKRILNSGTSPHVWKGPGTPLSMSVKRRSFELVSLLLHAHASPNEVDNHGVTVLHHSVYEGQVEICKLLVGHQSDPNAADRHGQTPLFFSPTRHVCELLCKVLADPNVVNQMGQSALHLAGRAALTEVLLFMASNVVGQCFAFATCMAPQP